MQTTVAKGVAMRKFCSDPNKNAIFFIFMKVLMEKFIEYDKGDNKDHIFSIFQNFVYYSTFCYYFVYYSTNFATIVALWCEHISLKSTSHLGLPKLHVYNSTSVWGIIFLSARHYIIFNRVLHDLFDNHALTISLHYMFALQTFAQTGRKTRKHNRL